MVEEEKELYRYYERRRHIQAIAVSGWEMQVVKPDKRRLVEEGILCYVCGYPLTGYWCNRCQDIGVKQLPG